MQKPDYTDLYRFQVSLGLILIALGPTLVWLYYRQAIDPSLTVDRIALLTPEAQKIIKAKQNFATLLLPPVICLFGGAISFVGIIVFRLGYNKWVPKQKKDDDSQDLDVEKRSLENALLKSKLDDLKPVEKEEKSRKDVPPSERKNDISVLLGKKYQEMIFEKIKESLQGQEKVDALRDKKLDNVEFDILLISVSTQIPSYVVEVKSFQEILDKDVLYSWLKAVVSSTYAQLDAIRTYRIVNPRAVVFLVVPSEEREDVLHLTLNDLELQILSDEIELTVVKNTEVGELNVKSVFQESGLLGENLIPEREAHQLTRRGNIPFPAFLSQLKSIIVSVWKVLKLFFVWFLSKPWLLVTIMVISFIFAVICFVGYQIRPIFAP